MEQGLALPPLLMRRYQMFLVPGQTKASKHSVLRDLMAHSIGKLTTVRGVVVRIGGVSPLVQMVS